MTRFAHVAGDAVLDVVNTVDWRLDPARALEQLVDVGAVLGWCVEAGLLSPAEGESVAAEVGGNPRRATACARDFRDLRETAYRALVEQDPAAVTDLTAAYARGLTRAELGCGDDGRWEWRDVALTRHTPMDRLTRGLIDLLRSERVTRLHQCEDVACGWVYLDTSPRRNRRWCAAADCGDRNRARAYYRRKKEKP